MKKLFSNLIAMVLIIYLFSTIAIKSSGSEIFNFIEFSSMEDFLNAFLITKDGGDIEYLIQEGLWSWGENPAESVNFAKLETLHLPIIISENFIARKITVDERFIFIEYLPKDVDFTRDTFWDTTRNNPSIYLVIWLDEENWIEGVLQRRSKTIEDLIDGKYLAQHSIYNSTVTFNWQLGKMYLGLQINIKQQHTEEFKELFGDGDVLDLVRFAETRTVDLTDEEEVRNLIKFGERFQRGDISGSGRVTTSDALEILRFTAGLPNMIEGDERAEAAADVNGDGKIDTADAVMVLRRVAGLA